MLEIRRRQPAEISEPFTGRVIVEVDHSLIDLQVLRQGGSVASVRMVEETKAMAAYFGELTRLKVNQSLVPWITRQEVAAVAEGHFTLEQLYEHMLGPLSEVGLLEVSKRLGYRLLTRPNNFLEALSRPEPPHILNQRNFNNWVADETDERLLEPHLADFLSRISGLVGLDDGKVIGKAIVELSGLERTSAYRNMKALEEVGYVNRGEHNVYKVGHLNRTRIRDFLSRQIPLVVHVRGFAGGGSDRLRIADQLDPEFPEVAWEELGARVNGDDIPGKEEIGQVMFADFDQRFVMGDDVSLAYSGKLPMSENKVEKVLGVCEFLGIGPKEIERIITLYSGKTIAEAMSSIETGPQRRIDQLLLAEVKARILTATYKTAILIREAEAFTLAEVLRELEDQKPAELPIPITVAGVKSSEVGEVKADLVKTVLETPEPDERFLQVLKPATNKEVANAAASDKKVPKTGFMVPLGAYYRHRSLSFRASKIPWDDLVLMGLARRQGKDGHPEITPGGALLSAVYLNRNVVPKAKAIFGNRALTETARHLIHMLVWELAREPDKKGGRVTLIKSLLNDEGFKTLKCECEDCEEG
ncbi:MAG: hypothetical protein ACD_52C00275G0005 [uncultured bacterium]|uniref:Uncharacterized protein n=1 Tax=Candidatus Woesebacteria bacterium RIFCSPHIGHO2_12_FULL_41_24 TaxID=1802510 RepID=A0A1F8AV30_9BACT|nr:MAG: hypothetical protein ACD_52C00275G0005 [uncultured bacterium]OGM14825.1 MAG: hypothetical protein A2W15_00605 [Candidatus Woesebacteria bacterium RBG_16_41_13]OGM30317.1 MAG: hypothetical protein A2873_05310 [Candidatus Woesebacteria bacterium RIFCSPHIGHO2_01_FULL_42_80]OGM34356.1 MAG: hypothetical protein A3D84_04890 [Candidatus Woesebacteria bacterium RIFCSPHIGHO2_02_FULL_42_20]OGM55490.1 MAG: hypothetical protein A3E44_01045 [Candidatus Woesebacteria bacterium RIFCSPHIGHO2_12_FULL_41